jgi:hypothetical protein
LMLTIARWRTKCVGADNLHYDISLRRRADDQIFFRNLLRGA